MRMFLVMLLCAGCGFSQAPAPAMPKLTATPAEVQALIAKAKAERKPDQANFSQPIVRLAPYSANLEYRVGASATGVVHPKEAELIQVLEGTGTITTGGTLVALNPGGTGGSKIEGGEPRKVAKGDFLLVPAGTPHGMSPDEGGALILMTLHLPVQ